MLARPFRLPEWFWACAGAIALLVFGLVDIPAAAMALSRGTQVYLFLIGMMALTEVARNEGLFEWFASHAVITAKGSAFALFALVYGIGVLVTAFLSNDATAIVLTPAVLAAARRANVTPYPFLYACAFVANAASFVLPIGNPANLVIYDNRMPPLASWFATFGLAAIASVALTFLILVLLYRKALRDPVEEHESHARLGVRRAVALGLLVSAAIVLVSVSAFGLSVGTAAFFAGLFCTIAMATFDRRMLRETVHGITWSIVPLVAGLFIIVAAIDSNGGLGLLRSWFSSVSLLPHLREMLAVGSAVTIASNAFNNLPVALLLAYGAGESHPHALHAGLVAVDLGPNLSVTGSLATLLWLGALRREGLECSAWQFSRTGFAVTLPALAAALLLTR